jgi:hypothetical protein
LENARKAQINTAQQHSFFLSIVKLGENPFRNKVFLINLRTSPQSLPSRDFPGGFNNRFVITLVPDFLETSADSMHVKSPEGASTGTIILELDLTHNPEVHEFSKLF